MVNAKAATPAAANTFRKLLSVLKRVAIDAGWRKDNPVATVKGIRTKSDGFRTWTDEEIAAFRARHEVGTKPRLALELLLCTGQRRGDAVRREREAHAIKERPSARQRANVRLWEPIPEIGEV
jgi:site-specific recombinase XerD